jgi:hypothetical protein
VASATAHSGQALTSEEALREAVAPSTSFLIARARIRQTLAAHRQSPAVSRAMDRPTTRAHPPASRPTPPQPAPPERPRRDRPPGTSEERDRLRAYLTDFMLELHDEASLPASITRAVNLFKQANIPPERWDDFLYQARTITQEHSGSIKKGRSQHDGSLAVKNKAPYFFAVLQQLVGLRPDPRRTT